jgi:hypothetical protein
MLLAIVVLFCILFFSTKYLFCRFQSGVMFGCRNEG